MISCAALGARNVVGICSLFRPNPLDHVPTCDGPLSICEVDCHGGGESSSREHPRDREVVGRRSRNDCLGCRRERSVVLNRAGVRVSGVSENEGCRAGVVRHDCGVRLDRDAAAIVRVERDGGGVGPRDTKHVVAGLNRLVRSGAGRGGDYRDERNARQQAFK